MEPPPPSLLNETLLRISAHIHPQDIDNFILACGRFYWLSKDIIEQHRERKKRYQEVSDKDCLTIPLILSNSSLAWYTKQLVIYKDRRCYEDWQEDGRTLELIKLKYRDYYFGENLERLHAIVQNSSIARGFGYVQFMEEIKLGQD